MGGSNRKENIVSLTSREHFIAHRLLVKMVSEKDYLIKLLHALSMMRFSNNNQERVYNSRIYAICKEAKSKAMTFQNTGVAMNISDSERNRRSESLKIARTLRTYKPLSEELKEKISNAKKGKPASNKGKPAPRYICPFCNSSVGGASNYKRWHGDNCKTRASSYRSS